MEQSYLTIPLPLGKGILPSASHLNGTHSRAPASGRLSRSVCLLAKTRSRLPGGTEG